MKQRDYYMGVDLGQAQDYTAITVVERLQRQGESKRETIYQVGHLERMALGTSYPAQVDRILERFTELRGHRFNASDGTQYQNRVKLIVDATGVGRPVVDMLKATGLSCVPVVITGADSETHVDGYYRVPKRNLVSVGQVLLQTGRLHVHSSLRLADTLLKELQAFKVTLNRRGHDTYGNDWRENDHDDLVLSTLLAVWWPEKRPHTGAVAIPKGWHIQSSPGS